MSEAIADEARAALAEAERADPKAHGYTAEDLRDMAEFLHAAASHVEHKVHADRARDITVKLARRITKDGLLTDEEAIRSAGSLAFRFFPRGKLSAPVPA